MPRLSEQTRATRRRHILTSAWACFSRNGFQATSMDEVIAATGMSSSAVYRYFRGKDELIDATAEEGLAHVRNIFTRALAERPTPTPADLLGILVSDLRQRSEQPDFDMTRIAIQSWAEALRRPKLQARTRALYREAREELVTLTTRWQQEGYLSPDANPRATAVVLFTLMPGLLVGRHLVDSVSRDDLIRGIASLAEALASRTVTTRKRSPRAPDVARTCP
ncbi:MAG TPA: TetR/AcrR family transcriptional regulator [Pseudonocardia sp.]|jgi:AcrR family transcriptional regulator|uniref:TetR/AcrR family transcriptional regulator n=1 Tax=Pseudonocardia sp. TaxID=60912 RepID=UPI002CB0C167|nr:TetR/AcrR family transcriptional regulator [Pseudonocardia sp.]HTF45926.1 TetR/AcrR family transcriptional regulator [Pseudonocardia sp.]